MQTFLKTQRELMTRLAVALLLTAGVLLPLLMGMELGAQAVPSLLVSLVTLTLLSAVSARGKARKIGVLALLGVLLLQLALPRMGLFGAAVETAKALVLKFSGLDAALPLFGGQVALIFGVLISLLSFMFSRRGLGFLPAATLVVVTLFSLWSLGRANLLWYTLPALVALLGLISLNSHEQITLATALPLAVIAALLGLLLLPPGRVTLPPLEKAAKALKQTITDYLFFTDDRNVFSLKNYGWYPNAHGTNQLGGDAQPSEYPVMTVKTPRKTLLRAVSKDEYDGHGFRDTSSSRRYLYVSARWRALRGSVFLEHMPPEAVRRASEMFDDKAIAVQLQNGGASTLYAPLYLRELKTQGDMVPYFNDAGELFITRDVESGDKYSLFAPVFEGGDGELEHYVEAVTGSDPNYAAIYQQYTQLPGHMEQKVFDDVADIIRGADTPYARAEAIRRHLMRYYKYTLTPGDTPTNQDFVTHFLYVGKQGYCTYFASAMTVMCRMAGLPARYVEGFLAKPATDGLAYVTGMDGHAWCEVYFEGFGWVPFDATPLSQNQDQDQPEPPPQSPPEPTPTPTPDPQSPDPTPSPTPQPNQNQDDMQSPPPSDDPSPSPDTPPDEPDTPGPWWLWLLLLCLVAALVFRCLSRMPRRMAARQKTPKERIFVYGSAVFAVLRQQKRQPKPGETPIRFASRLDTVHAVPAKLTPLARLLVLSSYSRMQPGQPQEEQAQKTWQELFAALSAFGKLRFFLRAGFDRGLYRTLDTKLISAPPAAVIRPLGPSAETQAEAMRQSGMSRAEIKKGLKLLGLSKKQKG